MREFHRADNSTLREAFPLLGFEDVAFALLTPRCLGNNVGAFAALSVESATVRRKPDE